jgi:hypothetical protein
LADLAELAEIERLAHRLGRDVEATWDALATAYCERPAILGELALLEFGGAAEVAHILTASSEARQQAIDSILCAGGLCDPTGRFVDVFP